MPRVRLLRSADLDLDALAHVRTIRRLGVDLDEPLPVCDDWALIARAGLRLWRRDVDVLVTVGEAALSAAAIAWRGAIVHVPVGTPTKREAGLLAGRLRRATAVTSTRTAEAVMRRAGVAADRLRTIEASPDAPSIRRAEAHAALGFEAAPIVVHVPGTVRVDSGHRLALWAIALLAYRDPDWRFLVSPRGDGGHAERFIRAVEPSGASRVAYDVDEPTLAAAADIAVFAHEGVVERSCVTRAIAAGSRIVAPSRLWRREGWATGEGVFLFDDRKPRAVGRAVADAADAVDQHPAPLPAIEPAAEGWRAVLSPLSRVLVGES